MCCSGLKMKGIGTCVSGVPWTLADGAAPPSTPFTPRLLHTSARASAPSDVNPATGVPDFTPYRASGNGEGNKTLQYFMVGSLGVLAASGAKSTVSDVLSNMAASADVLALAKIEVELGAIPEGRSGCHGRRNARCAAAR